MGFLSEWYSMKAIYSKWNALSKELFGFMGTESAIRTRYLFPLSQKCCQYQILVPF